MQELRPDYRSVLRETDAAELACFITVLAGFYATHNSREPNRVERTVLALKAAAIAGAQRAIANMA